MQSSETTMPVVLEKQLNKEVVLHSQVLFTVRFLKKKSQMKLQLNFA